MIQDENVRCLEWHGRQGSAAIEHEHDACNEPALDSRQTVGLKGQAHNQVYRGLSPVTLGELV